MKSEPNPKSKHITAKFGTFLGLASGDVPVYSSDYPSADDNELPNRHAYRSYVDDIFMGYKWQCVELARRWLYLNKGYIFDDVAMAYDIFGLTSVRVIEDNSRLPLKSFRNGSLRHPEPGALLIWSEGGEFEVTGHVAVITEVYPDRLRLIEQNVTHSVWPEGQQFSREIPARVTADGSYWLRCSYGDATILGWVIQTDDDTYAELIEPPAPELFDLQLRQVPDKGQTTRAWLNIANPDEDAYVEMMGAHKLGSRAEDQHRYFVHSETAERELKRATNELHALFMHATDYVLQDETLLEKFNIPPALWPKIHQSWDNRRNQMITGRFDFSMSARGIKVYEYNCDSASCYMEAGLVQEKWAEHFGCNEGESSGAELLDHLIEAWKASEVGSGGQSSADTKSVLHIMQDGDLEETYHALYMQKAIERAGITCKVIHGVSGLAWDDNGDVVDADGDQIRWVWKTWAWETALDQIRAECEDDTERLRTYQTDQIRSAAPRLVDVLLRKEVMVYEPLWTLIPSNKAILPVLWSLFPNHPYLLNSSFDLTDELQASGYVTKPIAGRCGFNISLYDGDAGLVEETQGRFAAQDQIYQELWKLPEIAGYNAQMCTFSVAGHFAGSCLRVDPTLVITKDSDLIALRTVEDERMKL
ncbi:bifunctional glutathionylspermidine amidase/synthase [Neptunomonas antarctica]|uniref:Glutathionylspermidine amidase/synthetase n=1 Tax=Neptunomonas antarctica TaxID=619304 RepID=A0A1N7MY91_9GAMM|nr:bifunctional glutathionylspermidine amidase/synthase [Neptunomonas antarctica]SIS91124.1 glutathionylspermidine amidase/synthetase [Neptunomonas antarctica]